MELTEQCAKFLAERGDHPVISLSAQTALPASVQGAVINRVVHPPEWLGWLFLSLGGVLVLHSFAMPKGG